MPKSSWRTAERMSRMQRSTIREILKIMKQKGMISFAGGLPAPELFPLRAFTQSMQKALKLDSVPALQYDVTEGYRPLKELLCRWLGRQGIRCTPEQMLLTNGSQQALDLLGKVLLDPNDTLLVEDPTYLGAIQAFNAYQPRYLAAPMDDSGMQTDGLLERIKKGKPKAAYLVPTFQNPSGVTMTAERRRRFLAIARSRRIPVIEDDPYGCLRFAKRGVPSLFQLAHGKGVVYLSTFSKILSPGIRLGFVVGEPEIIHTLVLAKQAADLQPNSLIQRAVYHYIKDGHLDRHIPTIIQGYRKRAGIMLDAMRTYFPSSVKWTEPEGGMFIWCRLPRGVSATELFKQAVRQNVAYVPGSVFYANGGGDHTLRLNFTNSTWEQIIEGIRRLAVVFKRACG